MDSFQHLGHDIEFPKDIKPNLKIMDEPTDMESSLVEQPISNEKIFEDFDVYNKQVHIQNFSNTLEAAMIWSNLRDFYPSSEDIIDIENESPNDDKSNRFENFENSSDFDVSVDIIDIEKDEKLNDIKTFDNFNGNSNFHSVNLTDDKGEFGDQSEQENNETSMIYFCAICPANFKKKSSLFGHFTAMHEKSKRLDCEICNSHFRFESSLERHMRTVHEKLKLFGCELCEATFGRKNQLKAHIKKIHGKNQNFNCKICNSHFRFESKFKSHMKILHQNLKPFSCKSCMKTFGQTSDLKRHIKSCKFGHQTMKPIDCSLCDTKFNCKVELESHMKSVHSKLQPHGCNECNKKYGTKLSLQKHIRNFHQEKVHEGKELDILEQKSYDNMNNYIIFAQENNTSLEMNLAETSLQTSSILVSEEIEKNENVHQDWKQFLLD